MLLSCYYPQVESAKDCEISSVTSDTRQVRPGSLFVCIRGAKFDGHAHVAEAEQKGAAAVVAAREVPCGLPLFVVANTRAEYGRLCARFWGDPASRMRLIGVTGTNGKTTITSVVKQILAHAGRTAGLIGTIQNEIGELVIPAKFTTPDPAELHALFARMERAGCGYVSMEVSSMALDQDRLSGCRFAVGVFTNLTQDHLDYHGSMEAYFAAKCRLFGQTDTAVVNLDDPYGRQLLARLPAGCRPVTYSGGDAAADFYASNVRCHARGVDFTLHAGGVAYEVRFCMPGLYSVENALAAIAAAVSAGLSVGEAVDGANACHGVRGRMEVLPTDTPYTVICDYAHSSDSLAKALSTVKGFAEGKVWALFGPAGCRDRTKRPKMAAAAARNADFVVLTSDNPRGEEPGQILDDAEPGFEGIGTPYIKIVDRYEAIRWVLGRAQPGDVVVLCGKGHEDYQVLADKTVCFDEHVIVQELLRNPNARRPPLIPKPTGQAKAT